MDHFLPQKRQSSRTFELGELVGLIKTIKESIVNLPGWSTGEKLVIFESDDWGAVRMPDTKALTALKEYGLQTDKCPYLSNDKLESAEDLEMLIDLLSRYKDAEGQPAKFTLNTIMTNPDFSRIGRASYGRYYFEHFHETYARYGYDRSLMERSWQSGIDLQVIRPQFHGREHIQVNRWMKALKDGCVESLLAFNLGVLGISTTVTKEIRPSYLASFDFDSANELEEQKEILTDGLHLFDETFGFRSASFIAPNYTWSSSLEDHLAAEGVRYIQGARAQRQPVGGGATVIKRHYMGQRSKDGQRYFIRNVQFEPAFNLGFDWVGSALQQIGTAFFWNKPAIVTSHRVNYVGGISAENRKRNLRSLGRLLSQILSRYQKVRFLFSDDLGTLMTNSK